MTLFVVDKLVTQISPHQYVPILAVIRVVLHDYAGVFETHYTQ